MELDEIKTAVDALADGWDEKFAALNERADSLETAFQRKGAGASDDESETKSAGAIKTERKAVGAFVSTGDDAELKSLTVGDNPAAGYLVDTQLQHTIQQKLFDQSPMRQLSRVVSIPNGEAFEEPWDVSDVGATWAGETEARTEQSGPSVKMLRVDLNEIYSMQVVTQALLDLAYVDIASWLENKLADKFSRTEGSAFLTGDGVKKPQGLLTYDTDPADDDARPWGTIQTVASGASTDVTADALKNIFWTLRAPYRAGASWMMSSATASVVDKLKDGQGQYLWRDGLQAGGQPSLLGRPVYICEDMPSVSAGNLPIAFGNFQQAYLIVDWSGMKLLRDPYSAKPYVQIYGYRRTGGGLQNSEAVKFMEVAAT
jgi:HK97 family phage major capsid protein